MYWVQYLAKGMVWYSMWDSWKALQLVDLTTLGHNLAGQMAAQTRRGSQTAVGLAGLTHWETQTAGLWVICSQLDSD